MTPIEEDPDPVEHPVDPRAATRSNASRHHEITADLNTSNVLPEGSSRSRQPNRRFAHAALLDNVSHLSGYFAAFTVGLQKDLNEFKNHRDSLPSEPKSWRRLLKHPYKISFVQAAQRELEALQQHDTFEYLPRPDNTKEVLPLLWVFKYKFDTDGFLPTFKARLCVRGDLQSTEHDTYAATLAAKTSRALMAITAAFDLEAKQYDVTNAFINAKLNDEVYCECPEGFQRPGHVLRLNRALYGIKQSPLLWLNAFSATLEELGLLPVSGVNCLFCNEHLIVFFYVDDIIVLYARQNIAYLRSFETNLLQRYQVRSLGDLKWFLGIRIQRDRDARKMWLCQDSYISSTATFVLSALSSRCPKTLG